MEKNEKLSYTITWTQPYPYSMDFLLVDLTEAFEKIVEDELQTSCFTEANEIINMIRNKK